MTFESLARLPAVQHYETAFRKATGVSLRLVPPDALPQHWKGGESENPFCALVGGTPTGCAACLETETRAWRSASSRHSPQQLYCYAGLTVVAVPVFTGQQHAATLLSGQVFRREPTERDFLMVAKMLGPTASGDWLKRARKFYFDTPVVTVDRFQAVLQLLNVFAQQIADFAERHVIETSETEPIAIASAKQFVQTHVEEPISLGQVVDHVHVSRFYFCKLFKKVTGMTLTEYISCVRVEKAKSLLAGSSLRISEVVFAAGFGSVPRFNSVFKRHVGVPPTEYRASLRSEKTSS